MPCSGTSGNTKETWRAEAAISGSSTRTRVLVTLALVAMFAEAMVWTLAFGKVMLVGPYSIVLARAVPLKLTKLRPYPVSAEP